MPSASVVVAYFLPVSVLVAVTATPGSGTPPAFTVPLMLPPCGAAGAVGVAEGGVAAGEVAGAAGGGVAGVCAAGVSVVCASAPGTPEPITIAAAIANPLTSFIP